MNKQAEFLARHDVREVMYGGAAGGGKTDALLMGALQFVQVPGYSALVLMKTFADLALPSAAMSRARAWLAGTAARPADGGRSWHFPGGATLTFGYLDNEGDEQRYRTAEFQYVAFDELTRFPESAYRYLFSRLRRLEGSDVPIRMRSATNPGGKGHEWVKRRFLPPEFFACPEAGRMRRSWWKAGRLFVPATLEDNPHLDRDDYERSLAELPPVVRAQLRQGDWQAHEGGHFQARWFRPYTTHADAWHLPAAGRVCRMQDAMVFAAVDPAGGVSESADYTAVVVCALCPSRDLLVLEVTRERWPVERVVGSLARVCERWRPAFVVMEDAFMQSAYVRVARADPRIPTVHAIRPGGQSKLVRATPAILRAEAGQVWLPAEAPWREDFLAELCAFTGDEELDAHDDQVDALAYAVMAIDRFRLGAGGDGPAVLGRRAPR